MTDLFDQDAFEDLDDFESDDFEDDADGDLEYVASMWKGYSFRKGSTPAEDTVVAHGMVQSFINAFARDGHYVVSFDPNVSTAGTDMKAKHVVITPAPIADPNLTAEEAGQVLTGLAVHEISHPRYGRNTAAAVEKVFPGNAIADRLSNLLDDIRIERRFVADYPGYAGIFDPTLAYVGQSSVKANGGKLLTQDVLHQVNLAIAATRYPTFSAWTPETAAEAAWWNAWADRWSKEDAPKRHVEAIREALAHVAAAKAPKAEPKGTVNKDGAAQGGTSKADPKTGDDTQAQAPSAQDASNDSAPADQGDPESTQTGATSAADETNEEPKAEAQGASNDMSDEELNEATRNDPERFDNAQVPSCSGSDAVDQAARNDGTPQRDINDLKRNAQEIVETSRNIEGDGHGGSVDVAKSLKGLTHGRAGRPNALAARYIRNAILRSRTGHTAVAQHEKRGRLDSHGLARVGYGDTRIFEKRTAPSPGKYNVWVMVDASGSMDGWPLAEAAGVAHAMAAATSGTPTVKMTVWGWSSPFRRSAAYAGVAKVWTSGQDVNEVFRLGGLHTGGTPDSSVISWAARAIKRETPANITPVIIFISDGAGDMDMNERVAEAVKMGVKVASVSFGAYFTEDQQIARFGKGNCVPFAGSITATAKGLADLFAKVTSGK